MTRPLHFQFSSASAERKLLRNPAKRNLFRELLPEGLEKVSYFSWNNFRTTLIVKNPEGARFLVKNYFPRPVRILFEEPPPFAQVCEFTPDGCSRSWLREEVVSQLAIHPAFVKPIERSSIAAVAGGGALEFLNACSKFQKGNQDPPTLLDQVTAQLAISQSSSQGSSDRKNQLMKGTELALLETIFPQESLSGPLDLPYFFTILPDIQTSWNLVKLLAMRKKLPAQDGIRCAETLIDACSDMLQRGLYSHWDFEDIAFCCNGESASWTLRLLNLDLFHPIESDQEPFATHPGFASSKEEMDWAKVQLSQCQAEDTDSDEEDEDEDIDVSTLAVEGLTRALTTILFLSQVDWALSDSSEQLNHLPLCLESVPAILSYLDTLKQVIAERRENHPDVVFQELCDLANTYEDSR
jgi:hypothetical protein